MPAAAATSSSVYPIAARHDRSPPEGPPGLCPESDAEILVVGYLSAVAAALDERGVAVMTLHLDGRSVDGHRGGPLCGTLTLRPAATGPGQGARGPTQADWHQDTGWSARLRRGNGHLTVWRYLHAGAVPTPAVAAGFVAALAAGRDIGVAGPPPSPGRRSSVLTQLGRFAVPEPW